MKLVLLFFQTALAVHKVKKAPIAVCLPINDLDNALDLTSSALPAGAQALLFFRLSGLYCHEGHREQKRKVGRLEADGRRTEA